MADGIKATLIRRDFGYLFSLQAYTADGAMIDDFGSRFSIQDSRILAASPDGRTSSIIRCKNGNYASLNDNNSGHVYLNLCHQNGGMLLSDDIQVDEWYMLYVVTGELVDINLGIQCRFVEDDTQLVIDDDDDERTRSVVKSTADDENVSVVEDMQLSYDHDDYPFEPIGNNNQLAIDDERHSLTNDIKSEQHEPLDDDEQGKTMDPPLALPQRRSGRTPKVVSDEEKELLRIQLLETYKSRLDGIELVWLPRNRKWVPRYELKPLATLTEAWVEYNYGLDGKISIKELDENFHRLWMLKGKGLKTEKWRRKEIIRYIKEKAAQLKVSPELYILAIISNHGNISARTFWTRFVNKHA